MGRSGGLFMDMKWIGDGEHELKVGQGCGHQGWVPDRG